MIDNNTICAVVVTYNRKDMLVKCLKALLRQTHALNAIYIIDSASTDGTLDFLTKERFIKDASTLANGSIVGKNKMCISLKGDEKKHINIHYTRMPKNVGGAGGFYEGVKAAYRNNYDWIWVMDDDVYAENNCLSELFNMYRVIENEKNVKPAALACARSYVNGNLANGEVKRINLTDPFKGFYQRRISKEDMCKKYFKIEGATFEGLMINKKIVSKVGFPDSRFFIYSDDTDYCLRILRLGKIYYVPSAKIIKMRAIEKKLGLKYGWTKYYMLRNFIYLNMKYAVLSAKLSRISYELVRSFLGRIFYRHFKDAFLRIKCLRDAYKMLKEDRLSNLQITKMDKKL